MIFYTNEKATCYLTIKNEIPDEFLTGKEKKKIKQITTRTMKNRGIVSKEDSKIFREIERAIDKRTNGSISYAIEESIESIEDYDFDSYDSFEIDF